MKFLFGNQFQNSWIVSEDCPNKVECPLDLYKYSRSKSAKVSKVKTGNYKILKEYFYTDEYGFMFDAIEFQMYGEEFGKVHPEESRILKDKQASGYLNLDDLIDISIANSFIPKYQFVYSIYAGDTSLWSEMTEDEQNANFSITQSLEISDR